MRERRQILELHQRCKTAALATLIAVEGSSYRRTGARLLVCEDGQSAGGISGGCLEADVVRKSMWLVRAGAVVEEYSTLFDDTADMPYGLGCGGTVRLLLEPADTPEFYALMEALQRTFEGRSQRIVTLLPSVQHHANAGLMRRVTDADGTEIFSTPGAWDTSGREIYEEVLLPPQRLLIFGAGNDAQPLVAMAALLGWATTVIDSRPQMARTDRFPDADRVLSATSVDDVAITGEDAVIVMTHSYEQDLQWLTAVLPHGPRYLGLLGARHRSALLVSEAAARLGWPLGRACESLYAPLGLDLGGDGAETIALAAVAEIQACVENKLGYSRRLTPELVEENLREGGAARYQQAQCAV
jgi:xanthine dehydrogenase accessory factor